MLKHADLVKLMRALRDEHVLSVYLDGRWTDFSQQKEWRRQLDISLKHVRQWLNDSTHSEKAELEQCITLLNKELAPLDPAVGSPGWVAFVTHDRVHHAENLPAPTPTIAVWSTGISVAPYVRALKEARPVVAIVADARKAAIYRYAEGELRQMSLVETHAEIENPTHMGDAPRQGFHPGARGSTGRDEAQRFMLTESNRVVKEATVRALPLAGPDGWLLTAGIPEVRRLLAVRLSESAPGRVHEIDALDIHSSDAEIAAAVRRGASLLRDEADMARINEVLELSGAGGLAALGPAETLESLRQSSVRDLYLTHRYIEDHAAVAEESVRSALEQGAQVEEPSREAARLLDEHGGMAARLRFRASPAAEEADLSMMERSAVPERSGT